MKLIDPSTGSKLNSGNLLSPISGALKLSLNESGEDSAQEKIIASMQKTLSNSFVLLRKTPVEGTEEIIPLILVGPPGVYVIHASGTRGVYRAKGDNWEKLDERQKMYKPAVPNLVAQTCVMGNAVQAFLNSHRILILPLDSVLIFSDPAAHVESVRPSVRVVMADAIDRFVSSLSQARPLLSQENIQHIVDFMAKPQPNDVEFSSPERDAFSFLDEEEAPKKPRINLEPAISAREQAVLSFLDKLPFNFTPRQWLVLGSLLIASLIVLTALILLVLVVH